MKRFYQLFIFLLFFSFIPFAYAHHILGIPHYKYSEEYPQIPFVEVMATTGDFLFNFTYYPGNPNPNSDVRLKLYIKNQKTGKAYREPLKAEILEQHTFGDDRRIEGPLSLLTGKGPEANDYKLFKKFPEAESYLLRVFFPIESRVDIIDFPITIGQTVRMPFIFGAIGLLAVIIVIVAFVKRRQA